jgi:hypothetical protein
VELLLLLGDSFKDNLIGLGFLHHRPRTAKPVVARRCGLRVPVVYSRHVIRIARVSWIQGLTVV